MEQPDANEINRLICRFTELQELWEDAQESFDWSALDALAREGAQAYNEGRGPSFHALALDGVNHCVFHERFLAASIQAGFDPFKLSHAGSVDIEVAVMDHADLADAARSNACSARMRASLMERARARFSTLAGQDDDAGRPPPANAESMRVIEACAESIPLDLLEQIAPELARTHHGETRVQQVDPIEGYLSSAEVIVESNTRPYG